MESVWNYKNTSLVHIELSNQCNAACPICPRYIGGSLMVNPELELGSITIEQFKKWFPLDFVERSTGWVFCGTNGDPMMAKDAYEILEYVASNSSSKIQVNTNGSMRSPDFWTKLGKMFKENSQGRRYVTFSVDGLEDTNHIYRRNVNWKRLMANMKAYCSTGAESAWDFLIFKHNEHQIQEAEALAKKIGVTCFQPKRPFGFERQNPEEYQDMHVYDEHGKLAYKIEAGSLPWRLSGATKKIESDQTQIFLPENKKKNQQESRKRWQEIADKLPPELDTSHLDHKSISCKSCHPEGKEIYVDCKGNVFPCCFVGTMFNGEYNYNDPVQIKKYLYEYGMDNISLKNYSLDKILNSGYLDDVFAKRWEGKNKMLYCFSICSVDHMQNLFVNK